ncbi:MAG: hypothetical protein ACP5D2_00535, partial [Candidatus Nanoarchaeia archaeon]
MDKSMDKIMKVFGILLLSVILFSVVSAENLASQADLTGEGLCYDNCPKNNYCPYCRDDEGLLTCGNVGDVNDGDYDTAYRSCCFGDGCSAYIVGRLDFDNPISVDEIKALVDLKWGGTSSRWGGYANISIKQDGEWHELDKHWGEVDNDIMDWGYWPPEEIWLNITGEWENVEAVKVYLYGRVRGHTSSVSLKISEIEVFGDEQEDKGHSCEQGYIGDLFCKNGDVYQEYQYENCTIEERLKKECCEEQECQDGACVPICTPETCSSLEKECGTWSDGCGGTLDCGTCSSGYNCSNGVCIGDDDNGDDDNGDDDRAGR